MRVLVAGTGGVVGRALVPLLRAVGHDVIGICRTELRADALRAAGVEAVAANALDREELLRAVDAAAPDAVVDMLTAMPPELDLPRLAWDLPVTNRLRTEDNRNLLDAARRFG
ncbi:NAD-dependent epimerase/dehydratase family protein, partial [Streptomyces sp. SID3343]|uniref:NAD-dependent epimerase/dehydratase family protein n=1 Tax=Streptomyces sp. SID3343 TaxID=2690260 RepID=UPI00136EF3A5